MNPKQREEAYAAINEVIADIKKNGVSKDEFLRSREQMKASLFFSNENSNSQMLLYGKYMLQCNQVFDFEKKLDTINQMTYEQSFEAIEYMFDESKKAAAIVGNVKKPLVIGK